MNFQPQVRETRQIGNWLVRKRSAAARQLILHGLGTNHPCDVVIGPSCPCSPFSLVNNLVGQWMPKSIATSAMEEMASA